MPGPGTGPRPGGWESVGYREAVGFCECIFVFCKMQGIYWVAQRICLSRTPLNLSLKDTTQFVSQGHHSISLKDTTQFVSQGHHSTCFSRTPLNLSLKDTTQFVSQGHHSISYLIVCKVTQKPYPQTTVLLSNTEYVHRTLSRGYTKRGYCKVISGANLGLDRLGSCLGR